MDGNITFFVDALTTKVKAIQLTIPRNIPNVTLVISRTWHFLAGGAVTWMLFSSGYAPFKGLLLPLQAIAKKQLIKYGLIQSVGIFQGLSIAFKDLKLIKGLFK